MQAARSPDAGLIGALHLAPSWIFEGHDTILAVGTGLGNARFTNHGKGER
jgi:hypothetical protein